MIRRLRSLALLLFVAVAVAYAAAPQFRLFATADDLEKGVSRGISIDNFGVMSLAPETTTLHRAAMPMLWRLGGDAQGNILAGGGNPAQVLSINAGGEASSVFSTEEFAVFALLSSGREVYIATGPDGQIYRLDASRNAQKLFKPEAKYIWALVMGSDGAIYAATGSPARIYRIDGAGGGTVIFESDELHVRSLVLSTDGWLYAGSSGSGYVYRLRPDGSSVSVLYDAPMDEIVQVLPGTDGLVYAAAASQVGGGPPVPGGQAVGAVLADEDDALQEGQAIAARPDDEAVAPLLQPGGTRAKSALYRISPTGHVKDLWSNRNDRILSAMLDKDGSVLVGTGDRGRLYRVNPDGSRTLLIELDVPQLTALATNRQGNVLMGSSNPGTVSLLRLGARQSGEYESEVIDAKVQSQWGALSWEQQGEGSFRFSTRTGNTGKPDKTWSPWQVVDGKTESGSIASPVARFLQWRIELGAKGSTAPQVKRVNVSYLQNNVAPEITQITVHAPGDYFPDALKSNDSESDTESNGRATGPQGPGRKTFQKGAQSLSWQARDDNNDRLQFWIYYRMIGESAWREIAGKLQGSAYSWDSQTMPDGEYQVRIVARDAKSNSPATETSGERDSAPFVVDNTPPAVQQMAVRKEAGKTLVSFNVEDARSRLKEASYALDTADWLLVYPLDGVVDQRREEFVLSLEPGGTPHTLTVKVLDAAGNVGFGRTTIGE